MISCKCTGEQILQYVHTLLDPDRKIGDLISVPNVLFQESWLGLEDDVEKQQRPEDAVLYWFKTAGFDGERSRNSFYGYPKLSGYQGLLQKLNEHPPWINVEIDDERLEDLTSLYLQVNKYDDLEQKFDAYLSEQYTVLSHLFDRLSPPPPPYNDSSFESMLKSFQKDEFRRLLHFSKTLGPEDVEALTESVMYWDKDLSVDILHTGSPDLLLWTKNDLSPFWFFAEVKWRNDHIRSSQAYWIRTWWKNIKGRLIIISVL